MMPMASSRRCHELAASAGGALLLTAALTLGGAIVRVTDEGATTYSAQAVLGASPARDLYIDPAGRPWVVGGGSVAVFEDGAWSPQGPENTMGLAPKGWAVAVDGAGDVLVAMGDVMAGGLDEHPTACPGCFPGIGVLRPDGDLEVASPMNGLRIADNEWMSAIREGPDGEIYVALAESGVIARVVAD